MVQLLRSRATYGEVMTEATVEVGNSKIVRTTSLLTSVQTAYMVVIGDITTKDAKKKLSKVLKGWKAAEVLSHDYEKTAVPVAGRIVMVDKPSAVQSVVWLVTSSTFLKDTLISSHCALRIRFLVAVCRADCSNLREDKAFTYGIPSSALIN